MAQTPNVLWIVMDSQRPHNIGAYGDQRVVTPTLDRLADEGRLDRQDLIDVLKKETSLSAT